MLRSALLPILFAVVAIGLLSDYLAVTDSISYGANATTAGTVLAATDSPLRGKDYVLEFPGEIKETEVLIWDFAAEDGDTIQFKANSRPITEPFILFHTPRSVNVPVGGAIEVIGIRDGGGGITYAVNFPSISTSIRNGMETGEGNLYTLNHIASGNS